RGRRHDLGRYGRRVSVALDAAAWVSRWAHGHSLAHTGGRLFRRAGSHGGGRHESDTLLGLLFEAARAPERLVRWRWEAGDVAFWDNRCTMHYALLDFGTSRRRMLRVALDGERPVGVTAR